MARRKPPSERSGRKPGTKPPGTSAADSVAALEARRADVFLLRRNHFTFAAIANRFNLSIATVRNDYMTYLDQLVPVEDVEDQRRIEMIRLDEMSVPYYRRATTGTGDEKAAATYLRIRDQYAKLGGLYAPIKLEGRDVADIARDLAAAVGGTLPGADPGDPPRPE